MRTILLLLVMSLGMVCNRAAGAESEVVVPNSAATGVTLAGTLDVPAGADTFLVLVTGSGPQDRDETVFGLKPFKVLSDALVAAGYGVLRMDDRGVGASTGNYETAVIEDFVSDADACVQFMRDKYPNARIGVLGHSLGGTVAIRMAAAGKCDFIVTLAAPAWVGDSLIMEQCRIMAMMTAGRWDGEETERRLLSIAKSQMPDYVALPMMFSILSEQLGEAALLPAVKTKLMEQLSPMLSPMYRDMLRYDPTDDISKVRVPWIAINGDKDTQVPVTCLDTIRQLCPSVTAVQVPGHNHLLQEAVTGLPNEYAVSGQAPSAAALELIIANISHPK